MADVFISYKREDRPLVRPLVRALQARGYTVWWDSRIETGENWLACIKRALDGASCVVVLCTPRSVTGNGTYASEIIEAEAEEGRKRGILLPVRMENGPLPFLHDRKQVEDLSEWTDNADDPAFSRLTGAIATHCGEREAPDPNELQAWLTAEDVRNADAYRAFAGSFPASRFAIEAEPRAAEMERRVADLRMAQDSARHIIEEFAKEVSKPEFTPPLNFTLSEREEVVICTEDQLFDRLSQGMKAVLHAGPGGGKTVKLLDWALAYCDAGKQRIGVFVRLKEIVNAGDEILAHLNRLEPNISEGAWSALARSGLLTLFCDGWNELDENERNALGSKLDIHARKYPAAGLVVGSRPLAPPPLRRSLATLVLERLSYTQIRSIVEDRLGDFAHSAIAELNESRDIADLVRTPFFLSAFCETRRAGTTPATRAGLIRGLITTGEQLPEHAKPLREILDWQQEKYLRSLAVEMLNRQQAELSSDDARQTVNRESTVLIESDLIDTRPSAATVLDTLRDHHHLIEHSGATSSYRFQHQLISEWYAANSVRGMALLALTDTASREALDRDVLNEPAWTESILFAVETAQGNEELDAIAYLVLRMLGIAPGFAADLIGRAPDAVWQRISDVVTSFVDDWRATANNQAMQFMVHCGKSDFSKHIWQAIETEKSGSVGQSLRSTSLPYPSVLGPDWRKRCDALSAEHRRSLLATLASGGSTEGAAMALDAAIVDASGETQATVAKMFDFRGYRDQLNELLRSAKPETWEELVKTREIDGLWDEPWREHAIAAASRVFSRLEPGLQKISHGLRLRELGEDVDMDFVSATLAMQSKDYHAEDNLLSRIAEFDGERLSQALLDKILGGEHVRYSASKYISDDAQVSQQRLLEQSRTKSRYRDCEILSPLLNHDSLAVLLSEFLAAHESWRRETGNERNAAGERYGTLEDALISADKNRLAEILLTWEPGSASQIGAVSDLMMRAYRPDRPYDRRKPLTPELRGRIVERLRSWAERLLAESKRDRNGLHSLAEAIATFPSTALLAPLRSLLIADLKQWRAERAEFEAAIERGIRPDPASGARLSNAYRYGQNMLSLATGRDADIAEDSQSSDLAAPGPATVEAVIDVLVEFLPDRLFGSDAARVIATLRLDPITQVGKRHLSDDLRAVPERREYRREHGFGPLDADAQRVISAINELRADGSVDALQHATQLANSVTRMNCGEHLADLTAFICDHGTLELISNHLTVRLLFGHEVDGDIAERCLEQLDARRDARKWEYNENWFKWEQLLVLMVFGAKPVEAAQRLLTYDWRTRNRNHDERKIIDSIGLCGHDNAFEALQIVKDRCTDQHMLDQWCSAVRRIGSVEAGEVLLETLLNLTDETNWHRARSLSEMVAELAETHVEIRDKIIAIASSGEPEQVARLAGVIRHAKDETLLIELLRIPPDRLARLGGAIESALYELCVLRRPVEGESGLAELIPHPISEFRAAAFGRAYSGDAGSEACIRLLAYVDTLRAEYGETYDEPRHPDLSVGKPWPPAAQDSWEASARYIKPETTE